MAFNTPAQKEDKIQRMMMAVGCTRTEARDYLLAEEWIEVEAIVSYRADKASIANFGKAQFMPKSEGRWPNHGE